MTRRRTQSGFTLVELLVVIAIIAVLLALLLPAVQGAREAARRVECGNHVRQLGLGCLQHVQSHGTFPTGGWGFAWVGDPDQGFDWRQPGGWIFNVLPYLEQQPLRDLQAGKAGAARAQAASEMIATPVPLFNCPSRRRATAYAAGTSPWHFRTPLIGGPAGNERAAATLQVARTCYAANGGVVWVESPAGALWAGSGPADRATGSGQGYFETDWVPRVARVTGVIGPATQVVAASVRDGLSNTYLVGEKYLNPDSATTGADAGDNESVYVGSNPDLERFSGVPPLQDQRGNATFLPWGSAHAASFTMGFCDGSVRAMAYDLEPTLHNRLGNRKDGETLEGSGF
jgi:prepilin-type N-terminal cleavage/methylation domain-containing protein